MHVECAPPNVGSQSASVSLSTLRLIWELAPESCWSSQEAEGLLGKGEGAGGARGLEAALLPPYHPHPIVKVVKLVNMVNLVSGAFQ